MKKTAARKGEELDPRLLGPCMLYCGYCGVYRNGNCDGCIPENETKAKQGKVFCSLYECSRRHGVRACADCSDYLCKKFDVGDAEDHPMFSKDFVEFIKDHM